MPLNAGTKLGPYEVVAALGAGGMGEVYRARDTRLHRSVAIKILPATLAADPHFRERFDREARAVSQLTHSNICTLHDVGEHDGTAFLVMELLDGETLEARLAKGALPVDQTLAIAIQIADALVAAHRVGIVHRDLKPGNIFLIRSGSSSPTAKLLDFGLAKTAAPVVATGGLSMASTTPPAAMTAAGTILGTFQYMAPEQIEGMEADARTDLFAFGCVLFEMLTGRKAFEGKTRASLLGAILKDEPPPVSQVQRVAPASLDRIVSTCLAKDPDDRWQTARDLLRELKWVASGASTMAATVGTTAGQTPRSGGAMFTAAAALASAALAGIVVWALTRPAPASRPVVHLQATLPPSGPLSIDGIAPDLAISPDGTRLAYTAGTDQAQLWVRQLDRGEATPLPGITNVRGPFFSPDGEWIAYFQGSDLRKVASHGGPPLTICRQCGDGNRGGTWGADDVIIFAATGGSDGLKQVAAAGGSPVRITMPDPSKGEQGHLWPEFLPGSQAILFTIAGMTGNDSAMIAWRDLKSGEQTILARGGSHPRYVSSGHVMYGVAGTLQAVGFDLVRHAVSGSAIPVMEHVLTKPSGSADFAVSRDGSLAYIAGDPRSVGQRLAWVDRQGHEEPIDAPTRGYFYARLSPDGRRVALDIRDEQNDIWIWDFERHVLTRLTTDPSFDQSPVWTPDGRRIAFASQRGGVLNLYWQSADGSGTAERLTAPSTRLQIPWALTPDGKTMVIRDTDPTTGADIAAMALDGDRSIKPLIHTTFNESNADISPDGRWITYQTGESGRVEIHVRPFPDVERGHWQVSTDGGSRPMWARSGQELFYVDPQGRIMAVPLQTAGEFSAGSPRVVAEGVSGAQALGRNYDVSPDGRRFFLIRNALKTEDKTPPPQLNVVVNWAEELKRLAPAKK
jgi:eukaryotic-like serine/threonine-protein kinase